MVAAAAGAQRLGATVVEVAPAGLSSPYPVHHGNEEMLIVLGGHPSCVRLTVIDGGRGR